MTRYRTVKVPTWVYDNAKLLLGDLHRRGTDALPERMRGRLRPGKPVTMGDIYGVGLDELARRLK